MARKKIMNLSISQEQLAMYLHEFAPSLEQFKEGYIHKIFPGVENPPDHLFYLCPLCLKNWMLFLKGGYDFNVEFSMDHFPPENVGGKLKALVCKKCNNDAGGEFDFVTKEWIEQTAFERKIPAAKIKAIHVISKVKGRFRGKLEIDDNGQIIMHLKNNEKDKIKPLDEWVNDPDKSNDYTIQMTIPRADKAKVTKAFLKTAYLNCFHHWGYQFVLSDTGKRMREVIFGDAIYPVDNVPFLIFHEPEYVSRLPFGVCFVKEPKEWQTFLVNIPLKHKPSKTDWVVSMVLPPEGGWDQLHEFNQFFDDSGKKDVSLVPLQPAIQLRNFQGYTGDWNNLTQSEL